MILEGHHELACQLAPEYRSRVLYVVDDATLADVPRYSDCLGWASPDTWLTPGIDAVLGDDWQGSGAIIGLDRQRIAAAAIAGNEHRCEQSVLIHELAHILPAKPAMAPPSADEVEICKRAATKLLAKPSAPIASKGECHDAEFCRRCVHLLLRAHRLGVDVPVDGLLGYNEAFGNWEAAEYVDILANEVEQFIDAPFARINRARAPREFYDLWARNRRQMKALWSS